VRTDFILSAEIIVISLGTVAEAPLLSKVGVLVAIAIIMTIGVYGLVAGIVKLDDLGLHLQQKSSAALKTIGNMLLIAAPKLMKTLAIVGTAAMFMVGGGILVHGLPALHHMQEAVSAWAAAVPGGGAVASTLFDAIVGLAAGALVVVAVTGASRLFKRKAA
jgi:predicted DNA repair protein MutK